MSAHLPVVCDFTGAPDTPGRRLDSYRSLFADALLGRERTADAIRFRLRRTPDVLARAQHLFALESACCRFFTFDVREHGDEIHVDATTIDDPAARRVLDAFYDLPVVLASGDDVGIAEAFGAAGLPFVVDEVPGVRGAVRLVPVTPAVLAPGPSCRADGGCGPQPGAVQGGVVQQGDAVQGGATGRRALMVGALCAVGCAAGPLLVGGAASLGGALRGDAWLALGGVTAAFAYVALRRRTRRGRPCSC